MTVNFAKADDLIQHPSGYSPDGYSKEKPVDARGRLLTPRQIRARARRKGKRSEIMTKQEVEYLYQKPMDEWDLDELAHGRPRSANGGFKGRKPSWITMAMHEEAMTRYTAAIKMEMRSTTVDAIGVLTHLINNDEVDEKGKPQVPWATKLDAAKFLMEHAVGKPTQRIEGDISVKLQGILAQVMVNPGDNINGEQQFSLGHLPGVTIPLGEAVDDDEDFVFGE